VISKTPDEWAAFKTRRGEFKQWLHTIHYGQLGNGDRDIRPLTVWAPLPWVWHENPDGGALLAMANLGILEKCPGDWPRVRTRNIAAISGNVYWVLCRTAGIEPLKQFLEMSRRQHLTTMDMIAEFDRKRVLFRKS